MSWAGEKDSLRRDFWEEGVWFPIGKKAWHMEKLRCGATDYGHVRFGSGSILHVNHPLFFHTFKTDLLLFSYLIAISTKLFLFQPMIFQFFT